MVDAEPRFHAAKGEVDGAASGQAGGRPCTGGGVAKQTNVEGVGGGDVGIGGVVSVNLLFTVAPAVVVAELETPYGAVERVEIVAEEKRPFGRWFHRVWEGWGDER